MFSVSLFVPVEPTVQNKKASYQFTSFFGSKGVKQGIDRRRGQGTGIPTTLLQDSVKKGTVNAATTLKQYKVVQRYKVVQKKTSCPNMCCQTLQFVEIYKLSKYTNCPKETKLSKKYKVVQKCGVRKYKVVRKMCCQKDNLSTHTYVLHNTRSTYHHHHGAP